MVLANLEFLLATTESFFDAIHLFEQRDGDLEIDTGNEYADK